MNLVFKEFLQTSIPPLISVLYAKGYHDFPLKNFCLTVPKNFVGESFCAVFQKIFGGEKVTDEGGGGGEKVSKFSVEYFLSHSAENFVKEPFSVSLISGIEKC